MKVDITAITFLQMVFASVQGTETVTRMHRIQEVLRRSFQRSESATENSARLLRTTDVGAAEGHHEPKDDAISSATSRRRDAEALLSFSNIASMTAQGPATVMNHSDVCTEENESLGGFFPSFLHPFWFSTGNSENFLNKYFDDYVNTTVDYATFDAAVDFTDMLELSRGPCEVGGGTLYSVSFNNFYSCFGASYNATNLPMCLGSTRVAVLLMKAPLQTFSISAMTLNQLWILRIFPRWNHWLVKNVMPKTKLSGKRRV